MTDKEFYRLQKKLDADIEKIQRHTDWIEKHRLVLFLILLTVMLGVFWGILM